ncbi:uncharacterized protein EDB91DRAFT_655895 [Suillus paluster]|uniref:uncharacterized protein n=1 Tax=Suillus paluster TaxID=48578 RepID=UPI001B871D63|nr:uncharacterized protein EDB91DRAFT_655895 [Suillus paluster]KAG1733082.1 hypothetical protein EDB91DRAFT_655895 [Suillus paluster]
MWVLVRSYSQRDLCKYPKSLHSTQHTQTTLRSPIRGTDCELRQWAFGSESRKLGARSFKLSCKMKRSGPATSAMCIFLYVRTTLMVVTNIRQGLAHPLNSSIFLPICIFSNKANLATRMHRLNMSSTPNVSSPRLVSDMISYKKPRNSPDVAVYHAKIANPILPLDRHTLGLHGMAKRRRSHWRFVTEVLLVKRPCVVLAFQPNSTKCERSI